MPKSRMFLALFEIGLRKKGFFCCESRIKKARCCACMCCDVLALEMKGKIRVADSHQIVCHMLAAALKLGDERTHLSSLGTKYPESPCKMLGPGC